MNKAFYAKETSANLISLGKLTDNNNTGISKENIAKVRIDQNNRLTAVALQENRTYKMKSILKRKKHIVNSTERNIMIQKDMQTRQIEYKLAKALYGLKESPRDWYECFDKYVTRLGLKKNNTYVLRKINVRARVKERKAKTHTSIYPLPSMCERRMMAQDFVEKKDDAQCEISCPGPLASNPRGEQSYMNIPQRI